MLLAQKEQGSKAFFTMWQSKTAQERRSIPRVVGCRIRIDHWKQVAAVPDFRKPPVDAQPEPMDRGGPRRCRVQELLIARHPKRIEGRTMKEFPYPRDVTTNMWVKL